MKTINLPQLRQTYNFDCGAKALQAVLAYYGLEIREDKIMEEAGTSKQGTPIAGIKKIIKRNKLKMKSGRMTITTLKKYIDQKIPVIVVLQAWTNKKRVNWLKDWADGHYVVVIGYTKDKIIFEDPSSIFRTYLTYDELKERWHDVDTDGKKYFNYGIAVFGKRPNFKEEQLVHMD